MISPTISLQKQLEKALGQSRVSCDDLTLISCAADAGCYRKIPKIVLKPENENQVVEALSILHQNRTALTFRAAGTSLSGQAISDSVLLQARGDHWSACEIIENGALIRAQPGITGTRLNQVLAPYHRKFGPDPASINSAMVGGIIANNASGMSCGIHANSYATIESARIIFADGTLLDTTDPHSRENFLREKEELVSTLTSIRKRILYNPALVEKIRRKYSIKNTTGYGMNTFLDYEDPVDMVLHLMVGSEGTLGFVSEATFRTIPVRDFRASSLIYFKNLASACNAVPLLRKTRIPAIEIMDREALRSVENLPGIPTYLKEFGKEVCALLIDLEAETQEALEHMIRESREALADFPLERDFEVCTEEAQIAAYWNVRKGVFPSVGGMRKPGTSVIIEDVAVHMEHLTGAVTDLRKKLDELDYRDAVIYGHVLDGNLHFIFSPDFQQPDELQKYENMIREVTTLIVTKYGGSLKAEHGTGLNMAPFVSMEWGDELYGYMKEIKKTFDPEGLLNPDVIISDDPEIHLKDFKPMPVIDDSVDQCIECGFCEINCLSNEYTLSARQRIVVQREVERLRISGENPERRAALIKSFRYAGNASCAGDGLCSLSCPLSIDTGVLIKRMRARANATKKPARAISGWTGNHFTKVHNMVGLGLGAASLAGKILPVKKLWIWDRHMPRPVNARRVARPTKEEQHLKVVYFPSCISQSMGTAVKDPDKRPLIKVTQEVLEKAGYQVIYPQGMEELCCGTPWESKGFMDMADAKSSQLEAALLLASEDGVIPVLTDTSPCLYRMRKVMTEKLNMYEPVEFIHDFLLDKLDLKQIPGRYAFHVTCTSTKMGLEEKFRKVAGSCTEEAIFPDQVGCCGFAGDKGFTQPALNSWALRNLKPQVNDLQAGYSNSRTCEIGLSRNGGIDYKSVMYLVHQSM